MATPILVRLFSDYAESVIWAPYPTDYADLGLDAALVDDLLAWDAAYYAGLENYDWKDAATQAEHLAEGRRLARLLAGALGDEFVIRIDGGEEFRSRHPPRQPAAAAALRDVDEKKRAEREEVERLKADCATLEWRAY